MELLMNHTLLTYDRTSVPALDDESKPESRGVLEDSYVGVADVDSFSMHTLSLSDEPMVSKMPIGRREKLTA